MTDLPLAGLIVLDFGQIFQGPYCTLLFAKAGADVIKMDAVDALVADWARALGKHTVFAATKRYRTPCAPVRDVAEVMADPHMHARGFLEHVDQPEFGPVMLPGSPLRLHGTGRVATLPSPLVGQHNADVYGGWLGLPAAEVAGLRVEGVI